MHSGLTRRELLGRAGLGLGTPALLALVAACGPAAPAQPAATTAAAAQSAPTSAPPKPTAAPAATAGVPGAAAPTATSAAQAAPASKPGGGGTLKLLWWQAPTILNAHLSLATKDVGAVRIYAEPLADFNAQNELVPILAAEIPSVENGGVARDGSSVTW